MRYTFHNADNLAYVPGAARHGSITRVEQEEQQRARLNWAGGSAFCRQTGLNVGEPSEPGVSEMFPVPLRPQPHPPSTPPPHRLPCPCLSLLHTWMQAYQWMWVKVEAWYGLLTCVFKKLRCVHVFTSTIERSVFSRARCLQSETQDSSPAQSRQHTSEHTFVCKTT